MKIKKALAYILIVLLGAYVASQMRTLRRWQEKERRIDKLTAEMTRVEETNRELQEELLRVKSDETVTAAIRDKLGWSKAGEQVVVLPGKKSGEQGSDTGVRVGVSESSWQEKFRRNIRDWLAVFGS